MGTACGGTPTATGWGIADGWVGCFFGWGDGDQRRDAVGTACGGTPTATGWGIADGGRESGVGVRRLTPFFAEATQGAAATAVQRLAPGGGAGR